MVGSDPGGRKAKLCHWRRTNPDHSKKAVCVLFFLLFSTNRVIPKHN